MGYLTLEGIGSRDTFLIPLIRYFDSSRNRILQTEPYMCEDPVRNQLNNQEPYSVLGSFFVTTQSKMHSGFITLGIPWHHIIYSEQSLY